MDPTLENVPARKLDHVAAVFKRHFTAAGRLVPGIVGARPFDRAMVRAWLDAVFGRCSLCGRCSLNCTIGIGLPRVFRAARAALAAMDLVPDDLQATVDNSLRHGNNMAITREDWVDTVQWLEEELQMETGDPEARLPLDKHGAKLLFTVNPREPKFFPLSLQASAKVFWAAREDWTLASDNGWDLTNYGLFNCNDERGRTDHPEPRGRHGPSGLHHARDRRVRPRLRRGPLGRAGVAAAGIPVRDQERARGDGRVP